MNNKFLISKKYEIFSGIIIFILSVIFAALLFNPISNLVDLIKEKTSPELYTFLDVVGVTLSPLSALSIFKILMLIHNNFTWKFWTLFNLLPNFNGCWCGISKGESESNSRKLYCVMVIKHTLIKMDVNCYFTSDLKKFNLSSSSIGYNYNLSKKDGTYLLDFAYTNEKEKNPAPDPKFDGYNKLAIKNGVANIKYFTMRNEPTRGNMKLVQHKSCKKDYEKFWEFCSSVKM